MEQVYESEIARMDDAIAHGASREVAQATKRKEKLVKQLKECKDYDDRLGHIALARIPIDLDDGVKVNYDKVQTLSLIHISVFQNAAVHGYKGTYNQIKLQDIENDVPKQFPVSGNRFAQVSTRCV